MHHLILIWRNFIKYKFFTLLNVFSISIGTLFILVIGIYAYGEYMVNKQLADVDRSYILYSNWQKDQSEGVITSCAPITTTLASSYGPLVETFCRFTLASADIGNGESFFRKEIQIVDSTFLTMFGFEMLSGNAHTALRNPDDMVITAGFAKKMFGDIDVIGRFLTLKTNSGDNLSFQVSGVLENFSNNTITNLHSGNPEIASVKVFINMDNIKHFFREDADKAWENKYMISYVKLQEGRQKEELQQALNSVVMRHAPADISEGLQVIPYNLENYYLSKNEGRFAIIVLSLAIIALCIFGLSIFNYINLLTAYTMARAKQNAVARILGADKNYAIRQSLIESAFLTILS